MGNDGPSSGDTHHIFGSDGRDLVPTDDTNGRNAHHLFASTRIILILQVF